MRLAVWVATFAAGIAVGVLGEPRPLALVALGGGALAAFVVAGARARTAGGALLAVAVAAVAESDEAIAVVARVARGPEWAGRGARLVLDLESVAGAPAVGVLALSVLGGWP